LAIGTSLFLYIHSYLRVSEAFRDFVEKRNMDPSAFLDTQTWVMILILSLLVAIIVAGVIIIFVYYQKVIQLYRMQQNFINGFTHELKTPIASLQLFLETFSKHELSKEQQTKYLKFMKRDTERLADNVHQILNLARIEEKKYEAQWQVGELKEVLEVWLKKTSYWEEEADIQLITDDNSEFKIKYDLNILPLVFMNLVNNAFIYNNSEKPQVRIHLKKRGSSVLVSFEDNGVGIARAQQKNVFKKFYQIKKSGKGSGIGLYLVQTVMKFHKGQVKIFSEGEGQGSTFMLQFPLVSKAEEEQLQVGIYAN
jgi:two-component system phosphate regulon sensor histidine kinase PhoR